MRFIKKNKSNGNPKSEINLSKVQEEERVERATPEVFSGIDVPYVTDNGNTEKDDKDTLIWLSKNAKEMSMPALVSCDSVGKDFILDAIKEAKEKFNNPEFKEDEENTLVVPDDSLEVNVL